MLKHGLVVALSLAFFPAVWAQDESFGEWIPLFNGKDLTGWQNAKPDEGHHAGPNRWTVEDGALTNAKWGGEGNDICTKDEFENYELELEFRVPKKEDQGRFGGANSGVYLRGQVEIQVFDSYGKKKLSAADCGAIYGGENIALENASRPAGDWNQYRILHVGDRITVWQNGKLIQDNVRQSSPTGGAMSKYPERKEALEWSRGPLMFQGDHSKVWYRSIRIRPLFGEGWEKLWNGTDLSEFTAHDDRRARDGLRWAVEDGAFTNTKWRGDGHDIWTKKPYGNFLAYYSYKSDPSIEGGNSGFYLRDQWEIQILGNQDTKESHSDGSLYSHRPPSFHARHAPERWNHIFVKLVGQKISVWQNGKLIHNEVVLPTRTDNHGVPTPDFSRAPFKLQGDHGRVWFTNLWIRPLPDDAK